MAEKLGYQTTDYSYDDLFLALKFKKKYKSVDLIDSELKFPCKYLKDKYNITYDDIKDYLKKYMKIRKNNKIKNDQPYILKKQLLTIIENNEDIENINKININEINFKLFCIIMSLLNEKETVKNDIKIDIKDENKEEDNQNKTKQVASV